MLDLIIFILVAYGISNIMVYGSIFNGFRNFMGVNSDNPKFFGKLFGCMMCLPTWVGFGLSAVFQLMDFTTPFLSYGVDNFWLALFLDGCLASGGVYAFNVLVERLEG